MESRRKTYTIRQLVKLMENKTIAFDYPIQRESGQWDKVKLTDEVMENNYREWI